MEASLEHIGIKVADETWIAVALLHRENPTRVDFTVSEIVARAQKENMHGSLRPGIRVHALLHCVANLPPNPGRYRMLIATGKSTRRLFHPGDAYHPARESAKITPERADIPEEYCYLLDWYQSEYIKRYQARKRSILSLRGLGRKLWGDEDPDQYVKRLREGWK
jgi:hypothetical protein